MFDALDTELFYNIVIIIYMSYMIYMIHNSSNPTVLILANYYILLSNFLSCNKAKKTKQNPHQ